MKGGYTVQDFRNELDIFYGQMEEFGMMDTASILQCIAAFSARMSHIRDLIMREREVRELRDFRIKELDPFLEEVDRQFRVWSRFITVQMREYDQTERAL